MIETDLSGYQASKYAKALFASDPKVGKTCFLVAQALGVFPGQKEGGIVSKPRNLHVVAFDESALVGLQKFLTKSCKASDEVSTISVYNMQDDIRVAFNTQTEYDGTFYRKVTEVIAKIHEKAIAGGTHAMIISSLTGLAQAMERAIIGPPERGGSGGKGYSDENKWVKFAQSLTEIRNRAQIDNLHCIWEAHLDKQMSGRGQDAVAKTSLMVAGKTGRNWCYNVGQVFRIVREHGNQIEGTKVDNVFIDTRPSGDFIPGGRGYNENLKETEADMTAAFMKLGLKVGQWGAKKVTKKEV